MAKSGYFARLAAPPVNVKLLVPGRAGVFAAPTLPPLLEAPRGAPFDLPFAPATASRGVPAAEPAAREADASPPRARPEALPRNFENVESEAMKPAAPRAVPARDGSALDPLDHDFGAPFQGLVASPGDRIASLVAQNAQADLLPARRRDEVVQWDGFASSQDPPAQTALPPRAAFASADEKSPAPGMAPLRALETPSGIDELPPPTRRAAAAPENRPPEPALDRDTGLLPAILPVPPPRETREARAAPPRLEIGVIEVRVAPPPAAAPPAAPVRFRAPVAARAGLAQRYGWRYGLAQS